MTTEGPPSAAAASEELPRVVATQENTTNYHILRGDVDDVALIGVTPTGKASFLVQVRFDDTPRLPARRPRGPIVSGDRAGYERVATVIGPHPLAKSFDDLPRGHEQTTRQYMENLIKGDKPSGIHVLRYGFASTGPEGQYPTLQLALRPATTTVARAVELAMGAAEYLYQFKQFQDVAIEVVEAEIVLAAQQQIELEYPWEGGCNFRHFRPSAISGCSLGAEDESIGKGTLGPLVHIRLVPNGDVAGEALMEKVVDAGLTCCHVVSDDIEPVLPDPENNLRVDCPAPDHCKRWEKYLLDDDQQVKNPFWLDKTLARLRAKMATPPGLDEEEKEELAKTEGAVQEMLQAAEYTSSAVSSILPRDQDGHRGESSEPLMDWALVKLDPHRVPLQRLPCGLSYRQLRNFKAFKTSPIFQDFVPYNGICDVPRLFSNLGDQSSHNRTVFKVGQKTGSTIGSINDVDSTTYQDIFDNMGNPCQVAGKMVSIVTPIDWKIGSDSGRVDYFGDFGDSGSPVFDYEGRLLGMYQAFQRYTPDFEDLIPMPLSNGDVHFVQRIDLIQEDMERALRADPSNAGYDVKIEWYSSGD